MKNKFRSFKTQLEKIGMPVFITSLTTAIGFLSFMFSSLIPLFRFGVITTITIFISLFVIVILYSLIIDFNINKNIKNNHFLDDLIVSIVHMSNVLGTINPVKEIGQLAHNSGAIFIVDGTQSTVHMPIDVMEIDADLFCMTGHKLYGPTGIGALYAKTSMQERTLQLIYLTKLFELLMQYKQMSQRF